MSVNSGTGHRPSDAWRLAACIGAFYSIVAILAVISVLLIVWGNPLIGGLVLTGGGIGLALFWGFNSEQIRCWCVGHSREPKPEMDER